MTDTMQPKDLDDQGLFLERPSSIKTFTGRVDPLNPVVDEINIEDIAHALSRQCRYNGHCVGFISVARHCIWVASHLETEGFDETVQLTGLLHDAAEAYLGDLVRPIKHSEFGVAYLKVEAVLEEVIAEKFGIPYPFPPEVYEADNYVLNELELHDRRYNYFGDYREDEENFLRLYYTLTETIQSDDEIREDNED
jgi:5'-deoxynucleotidase YfbR-like HD superfamily hydrolase